jgi:hypothetical protein
MKPGFAGCGKTQFNGPCKKGTASAGPIRVSGMSRASALPIHSLPNSPFDQTRPTPLFDFEPPLSTVV